MLHNLGCERKLAIIPHLLSVYGSYFIIQQIGPINIYVFIIQVDDRWYYVAFDIAITMGAEAFTALTWHGMWTIHDGLQTLFDHSIFESALWSLVFNFLFFALLKYGKVL